jgi:hypothetical protein
MHATKAAVYAIGWFAESQALLVQMYAHAHPAVDKLAEYGETCGAPLLMSLGCS